MEVLVIVGPRGEAAQPPRRRVVRRWTPILPIAGEGPRHGYVTGTPTCDPIEIGPDLQRWRAR
jgi:hypothetical protein